MSFHRSVVIWPSAPKWKPAELINELVASLGGRVKEAYLIGSYARDQADGDSDIDLILISNTLRAWPERVKDFADLFEKFGEVDLIVYTPQEWERVQLNPTSFIDLAKAYWKQVV